MIYKTFHICQSVAHRPFAFLSVDDELQKMFYGIYQKCPKCGGIPNSMVDICTVVGKSHTSFSSGGIGRHA